MNNYIAEFNDSFDYVAYKIYGDEMLASKIIAANPQYCDVLQFDGGEVLNIPEAAESLTQETVPPWVREVTDEFNV